MDESNKIHPVTKTNIPKQLILKIFGERKLTIQSLMFKTCDSFFCCIN